MTSLRGALIGMPPNHQDITTAIQVANGSMSLLSQGGFKFTKFMSNSRTVLQQIPVEKIALPNLDLDLDQLPIERTLGVHWNVEEDMFCFKIKPCDKPNTMRGVLSCISSFYDPIGFVAPVTPCYENTSSLLAKKTKMGRFSGE